MDFRADKGSAWSVINFVRSLVTAPNGARLSRTQKLVALTIATYYNWERGYAWPPLTRLARETSLSRQGVINAIAELVRNGTLAGEHVRDEKGETFPNHYRFPAAIPSRDLRQAGKRSVDQAGNGRVDQAGKARVDQAGKARVDQAGKARVDQAGKA